MGHRFDIAVELARLCARNKDGSFATQDDRAQILHQAARTLQKAGFQNLAATSLKPKHVDLLVKSWQADGLSAGTMKNRMSCLRWWAEKVGKQTCVPRTNDALGIERRAYVATVSKAQTLDAVAIDKLGHDRLKVSLELQEAFGLRREESLKFQPVFATKGLDDAIRLKASWCKGGRTRLIPIMSEHQRAVLAKAHALAGSGSMIPPDKKYVTWLSTYKESTRVIGAQNCMVCGIVMPSSALRRWPDSKRLLQADLLARSSRRNKGRLTTGRACRYLLSWAMGARKLRRFTWALTRVGYGLVWSEI